MHFPGTSDSPAKQHGLWNKVDQKDDITARQSARRSPRSVKHTPELKRKYKGINGVCVSNGFNPTPSGRLNSVCKLLEQGVDLDTPSPKQREVSGRWKKNKTVHEVARQIGFHPNSVRRMAKTQRQRLMTQVRKDDAPSAGGQAPGCGRKRIISKRFLEVMAKQTKRWKG